jgi:hypothetical protein
MPPSMVDSCYQEITMVSPCRMGLVFCSTCTFHKWGTDDESVFMCLPNNLCRLSQNCCLPTEAHDVFFTRIRGWTVSFLSMPNVLTTCHECFLLIFGRLLGAGPGWSSPPLGHCTTVQRDPGCTSTSPLFDRLCHACTG